ncbi:MAG TPA: inorganic phosphate transporter, partial [Thermococcus paralvinellae]|nr:inorganic phosphate transporter [Thermococcus paralvinellae]
LITGEGVDKATIKDIVFGWVATPTTAILIALVIFHIFRFAGMI